MLFIGNQGFSKSFFFADEKEKYDPTNFRDQIVNGLNEAQKDLEQVMEVYLK